MSIERLSIVEKQAIEMRKDPEYLEVISALKGPDKDKVAKGIKAELQGVRSVPFKPQPHPTEDTEDNRQRHYDVLALAMKDAGYTI